MVAQVHERLATAGQRVEAVFQELRRLQSSDGRNSKACWRRLVRLQLWLQLQLLQLAVGLKDYRLRVETSWGKKTLGVHLLPLLYGLAFLLLLLDYS